MHEMYCEVAKPTEAISTRVDVCVESWIKMGTAEKMKSAFYLEAFYLSRIYVVRKIYHFFE